MLLSLPPLVFPGPETLVDLLPELIVAFGFLVLLGLDLVTAPLDRGRLAAMALLTFAAAMGVTVWQWFANPVPHTVYSGAFALDRFGLFVNGIVLMTGALVVLISPAYLSRRGLHHGEYYALILAATLGMMFLGAATSLMVIFLGIELLSLALYVLSGFARGEEHSQEAAIKYLLLGAFASGFLLFGMALIYGESGHTQLVQIAASLHAASGVDPLLLTGIILLLVGLAFKISIAPFHTWTPDVYQGAPMSVTAFMSVATKVAAFAAVIRVFTYTLDSAFSRWHVFVYIIAILSMVVGNVAALSQTSMKRMLAYSGIAQAGYILIGVAVLDPSGTVASLFYLAAYAGANLAAFGVLALMSGHGEDLDSLSNLRGLAYRRPYAAAALTLSLLSLGGFPPTAGFFAKLFVFAAAIHAGQTPLALWGIATSAVSLYYYLRVAILVYQRSPEGEEAYEWSRTSFAGGTAILATSAGTLVLGVFVFLVYSVAQSAQHAILP